MYRTVLNVALIGLVAGIFVMKWAAGTDPTQPNYRVLPNMADSPAYAAFAANPAFADGHTLREPPEGAIPRGHLPLHYGADPDEAARAGAELVNPLAHAPESHLGRGAAVYKAFCQACHGAGGLGDGEVTRRGVPPPPSLLAENAMNLPDGRMFHIITYGQGNMASYASQVSREDRWKVILHIRSLQGRLATSQPASATSPEPTQ